MSSRVRRVREEIRKLGYDRDIIAITDRTNFIEGEFAVESRRNGHKRIIRSGWPDFLLLTKEDQWIGVEVKSSSRDLLSPQQVACFEVLDEIGLLTYIWIPKHQGWLIPWRKHQFGDQGDDVNFSDEC